MKIHLQNENLLLGSDPVSDKSLLSAASASTVFGVAGFNKSVLLIIDPEKVGREISLFFTTLRPKTSLGEHPNDEAKEGFFKECIEPNGVYVRGMKKIFGVGIEDLRRNFRGQNRADDFCQSFFGKAKDPGLIGSIIENFFDYPYPVHNEPRDLSKLMDRCFMMVLKTFPALSGFGEAAILDGFVKSVLERQGWNGSPGITVKKVLDRMEVIKNEYLQLSQGLRRTM